MKRFAWILLMGTLLLLSGCGNKTDYTPQMGVSDHRPLTKEESGEAKDIFESELYFVSGDGRTLSAQTAEIHRSSGISRAEAALMALISGPSQGSSLQPSVPAGVWLSRIELSDDACNIYLTGTKVPESREWLILRVAMAATVNAAEGIGSVNVYFDEKEIGYAGRPLGAQTPITEALDVYLGNMQQTYDLISSAEETEAVIYESHVATLYFSNSTGDLLLARNTDISYEQKASKGEIASLLISKLLEGDSGEQRLEPVLPYDLTLLRTPSLTELEVENPSILPYTLPQKAKLQIMEIRILEPSYSYNESTLCGAITLTLTGYIPGLDGVRISMRKNDGTLVNLGGREDGILSRSMYAQSLGFNAYLSYPDREGSVLYRVKRAIPCVESYDPQIRLFSLLSGPADPGVLFPLFTQSDVKDIYVSGNMVVVDWASGFSEKLHTLLTEEELSDIPLERRESLFIYSIVNTLTELPGVERVWMLEEGEKLGTVGELYLGNALLRNPGIMMET